jgi:hypothetical protein
LKASNVRWRSDAHAIIRGIRHRTTRPHGLGSRDALPLIGASGTKPTLIKP